MPHKAVEITGRVKLVGPVETIKDFKKRELVIVIDEDGSYPQEILIEASGPKVEDANLLEIRPNDNVTVFVNLRGRMWHNESKRKDQYFNTLQYWKLTINQTAPAQQQTQQRADTYSPPNAAPLPDLGDIPF